MTFVHVQRLRRSRSDGPYTYHPPLAGQSRDPLFRYGSAPPVSLADLHDKKVGNKGDVWKHFILCGVADGLLQRHVEDLLFVYADSHCSLGNFMLPENGQWQRAIGWLDVRRGEDDMIHDRMFEMLFFATQGSSTDAQFNTDWGQELKYPSCRGSA